MEREIKFRGRCVITGAWSYGFFYTSKGNSIIRDEHDMETIVIPKTVGQSIGVNGYEGHYSTRHKNQVKLYEGDVVEAMSEGSKGTFIIKFREEGNPCWLLFPNWQSQKHWNISASNIGIKEKTLYDDLKRIGNIHEHPNLLTEPNGK